MTEEAKKYLAQGGALRNGQIPTQQSTTNQYGQTISSSSLSPTPAVAYQTPKYSPVYPVAGLNSDPAGFEMTAPEKQATDLTSQLVSLNSQLTGESAFRSEQEEKQGIPMLTQTQRDLSSRLQGLKNEALAIPLQLQQDATGRGITAGGLRPHETAALRNNAIQALSTASLLEAANGNITNAIALVDRAVKQKYDPIREEIAAKTANLDLILKSPEYSLAEKKRAQAQLDAQNEKARLLKVDEENQKTIQGLALQALQNDAPAAIVDAIMNSKDIPTAFKAAAGYVQKETATSIQEYKFAVDNGYKGSFSEYQNEDANRKQKAITPGVAPENSPLYLGLNPQTATAVRSQVSAFKSEPVVTNFSTLQEGYDFVNSIGDKTTNPSDDQSLIYALAKALDPGSVVREGEYATAQKYSQSLIESYGKSVTQAINGTGFLSETARKNIKETIKKKYEAAKRSYDNLRKNYVQGINDLTGRTDGEKFVRDYSAPVPSTNQGFIGPVQDVDPEYLDWLEANNL